MTQTQIPSGLQALMQASQVLSSQASPTAPGPQGPQPTVAERVNQQIKQFAQPPQPPQGGIAGLTPNMQEIGKQAGVAGQIMAQRQAQQQQLAQNPQAVAQMAAQMLQSKGVAGLPSNMGFKEGGIIGFDGEDGSAVPAPNVPGMDKLMEIMKNAEGTEVASTDNQAALQALAEAQKRLAAAAQSGDTRSAQLYAKQVADIRREIQSEPSTTPGEVVAQPIAPPRGLPDGTPTLGETTRARLKDIANMLPSGLPAGSGIELLRSAYADKKEPAPSLQQPGARVQVDPTKLEGYGVPAAGPAARPAAAPLSRAAAPAALAPSRAAAPTARAKTGIQTISIPETKVDRTAAVEPTLASLAADINTLSPKRAEDYNKEEAAREAERAKLKAGMADLNAEEIKALEEDKATRKQLAASKAERDQFNRVQSFFRDLYTRGDSYSNVQAGIFARDEAERLADKEHNKAVILLKKAQQAEKLGDHDRASALKEKAYERLSKEDKNRLDASKIAGELANSRYGQQMETARTEAQIKSANVRTEAELNQRNQALQANLDIERQKVAGMSEERKNSRQGQALTAALGRLNDATQNLTKVSDQNKTNLAMKDSKDPTAQAMYKQAEKNVSTAEATYQEAKRVFDSIAADALKGYATTPAKPAGGAKPDFIWDQKTQKMVPNK
jgi:hypothetical protein